MNYIFRAKIKDFGNLSTIKYRKFDAHIFSMHQSGTHWLKHMLALALARSYDLPLPGKLQDDSIVGHPKSPPIYSKIPQIVHSHTIPSPLVSSRMVRSLLKFPRYIILVRDPRAALVSHYEKWKNHYKVEFEIYLKGDPKGEKYDKDVWWDLRFLNAWGRVIARYPKDTYMLKYENLYKNPLDELMEVVEFLGLHDVSESDIVYSVESSTKEKMGSKPNPANDMRVIRQDDTHFSEWYSPSARKFIEDLFDRYLVYPFGYNFREW